MATAQQTADLEKILHENVQKALEYLDAACNIVGDDEAQASVVKDTIKNAADRLVTAMSTAEEVSAKLQDREKVFEQEVRQRESTIEDLDHRIREKTTLVTDTKEELNALKKTKEELQKDMPDVDAAHREFEKLQEDARVLKAEMAAAEELRTEEENRIRNMRAVLEKDVQKQAEDQRGIALKFEERFKLQSSIEREQRKRKQEQDRLDDTLKERERTTQQLKQQAQVLHDENKRQLEETQAQKDQFNEDVESAHRLNEQFLQKENELAERRSAMDLEKHNLWRAYVNLRCAVIVGIKNEDDQARVAPPSTGSMVDQLSDLAPEVRTRIQTYENDIANLKAQCAALTAQAVKLTDSNTTFEQVHALLVPQTDDLTEQRDVSMREYKKLLDEHQLLKVEKFQIITKWREDKFKITTDAHAQYQVILDREREANEELRLCNDEMQQKIQDLLLQIRKSDQDRVRKRQRTQSPPTKQLEVNPLVASEDVQRSLRSSPAAHDQSDARISRESLDEIPGLDNHPGDTSHALIVTNEPDESRSLQLEASDTNENIDHPTQREQTPAPQEMPPSHTPRTDPEQSPSTGTPPARVTFENGGFLIPLELVEEGAPFEGLPTCLTNEVQRITTEFANKIGDDSWYAWATRGRRGETGKDGKCLRCCMDKKVTDLIEAQADRACQRCTQRNVLCMRVREKEADWHVFLAPGGDPTLSRDELQYWFA